MGASTCVPATIFSLLAKNIEKKPPAVQADRKALAKAIDKFYVSGDAGADGDFNDGDLDCYDELRKLGLAKTCKHCGGAYTEFNEDDHGTRRDQCAEPQPRR